jgi:hypothetical protein
MDYPDIMKYVGDDEVYLEGGYMFKGNLETGEETSHLFVKRVIKRDSLDEFAKDIKYRYGVNRFNPVYIEK